MKLKPIVALITVVYTVMLLYWMFIGFGRSHGQFEGYRYNLIPFNTIQLYFRYADHFNVRTWLINIVGNVAVFVPFGVAIPYLTGMRFVRFVFRFAALLAVLELLQLLLRRGSLDVDDILLNTAGAVVGFMLYRIAARRTTR